MLSLMVWKGPGRRGKVTAGLKGRTELLILGRPDAPAHAGGYGGRTGVFWEIRHGRHGVWGGVSQIRARAR